MAGLCAPLSTLRRHPRGYRRMTRGQCGSLDLHCKRLALSTPCRSSRRTEILDYAVEILQRRRRDRAEVEQLGTAAVECDRRMDSAGADRRVEFEQRAGRPSSSTVL